jgi:hypothetical protein
LGVFDIFIFIKSNTIRHRNNECHAYFCPYRMGTAFGKLFKFPERPANNYLIF